MWRAQLVRKLRAAAGADAPTHRGKAQRTGERSRRNALMQRVHVDLRAPSWRPYAIRARVWGARRVFETLIFVGQERARLGRRVARGLCHRSPARKILSEARIWREEREGEGLFGRQHVRTGALVGGMAGKGETGSGQVKLGRWTRQLVLQPVRRRLSLGPTSLADYNKHSNSP